MTEGGFGFHGIWQNLIQYIDGLDIERVKQKAGIKSPAAAPAGARPRAGDKAVCRPPATVPPGDVIRMAHVLPQAIPSFRGPSMRTVFALLASFMHPLFYQELYPVISKWSPEYFVSKDTPPIFIENEWGLTRPENIAEANYRTHSPVWGIGLKKYVEARGVTCYQKYPGLKPEKYQDIWDFLIRRLQPTTKE